MATGFLKNLDVWTEASSWTWKANGHLGPFESREKTPVESHEITGEKGENCCDFCYFCWCFILRVPRLVLLKKKLDIAIYLYCIERNLYPSTLW